MSQSSSGHRRIKRKILSINSRYTVMMMWHLWHPRWNIGVCEWQRRNVRSDGQPEVSQNIVNKVLLHCDDVTSVTSECEWQRRRNVKPWSRRGWTQESVSHECRLRLRGSPATQRQQVSVWHYHILITYGPSIPHSTLAGHFFFILIEYGRWQVLLIDS